MTKKAFDMIAAGLEEAIARGEADPSTYRVHTPADIDVLKIRRGLGLTREAFAMRFGLELGTVRDWEQRKRRPEGPARVLLTVIKNDPDAVTRSLTADAKADVVRPGDCHEMPRLAAARRPKQGTGAKQGIRRA